MKRTIKYMVGSPNGHASKDEPIPKQPLVKQQSIANINDTRVKKEIESSTLNKTLLQNKSAKILCTSNQDFKIDSIRDIVREEVSKQIQTVKRQSERSIGELFKQTTIETIAGLGEDLNELRKNLAKVDSDKKKIAEIVDSLLIKSDESKCMSQVNTFKRQIEQKLQNLKNKQDETTIWIRNKNQQKCNSTVSLKQSEELLRLIQQMNTKTDQINRQLSNRLNSIQEDRMKFWNKKNMEKDEKIERNIENIIDRLEEFREQLGELKSREHSIEKTVEDLTKHQRSEQKSNKKQVEQLYKEIKMIKTELLQFGDNCDKYDLFQAEIKNIHSKIYNNQLTDMVYEAKEKVLNSTRTIQLLDIKIEELKEELYTNLHVIVKNRETVQKIEHDLLVLPKEMKAIAQSTVQTYQNAIQQYLSKIISEYNLNFEHIQTNNSQLNNMVSEIIKINSIISQKLCCFVSNKLDYNTFKEIISEMNQKMFNIQETNTQKYIDMEKKEFKFEHELRILKENVEISMSNAVGSNSLIEDEPNIYQVVKSYGNDMDFNYFEQRSLKQCEEEQEKVSM